MKYNEIPSEEVQFQSSSGADGNGQLFYWEGELYRGIRWEMKDFYTKLLDSRIVQNLIKKDLLIETEVTHYSYWT